MDGDARTAVGGDGVGIIDHLLWQHRAVHTRHRRHGRDHPGWVVAQPAAPISAGGAMIGSDPTGAGVSSPGTAAAPAATPRSSGGGGGGTSQKPPTAAQGVPDSSTDSPVIAPPPADNTSSPPVLTDTKPEIVETVPPPPIQTAVPPTVTTPVPLSSEGTVAIVPVSASDNTVTPAPSDQAPVDSPEPATLTLLGVAGLGNCCAAPPQVNREINYFAALDGHRSGKRGEIAF